MKAPQEVQGERFTALLRRVIGPQMLAVLVDPNTTDLMVNEDGRAWVDAHGRGMFEAGFSVPATQLEALIGAVAAALGTVADAEHPIIEGELQLDRIRFEGFLPPVVRAPVIALRKPAQVLYTLADYVRDGIITGSWAELLSEAVAHKLNIVAAGGTGSGKTTLLGALINEMVRRSDPNDRYLILEDTREIQCRAENVVYLRTCEAADLARLVRATMRVRPTRIIVGETRGPECLALLKAWLTGHPGGVTSVHANSARSALTRLSGLVQEAGVSPQPELIAETVNLIAFIEHTREGRRVTELVRVEGYSSTNGFTVSPV